MRKTIIFLLFLALSSSVFSQVVPGALGKTNNSSFLTFVIKQDLDTIPDLGWSSTTYIALGRTSGVGSSNPFKNQGLLLINQEFYNRFHKNWEHSIAIDYMRQNSYSKEEPYGPSDPSFKNAFRIYGRISYIYKRGWFSLTPTFRQEFTKYFDPNFTHSSESYRMRSRFRLKFGFNLTKNKEHKISLYSEQLFSTSLMKGTKKLTHFEYKDSRFSVYYSYSPRKTAFTYSIGYMNNLIGTKDRFSGNYFALEVVWKNPFKKRK